MAARKKPDPVVRCFEVSSPTLHEKGHTVYKVTQRLIRVDVQEEDVKEVTVWRRYNDIKRLHKAMLKLHMALHRKEDFPPFAEAKMFGRFEEDVIIERMRSAQDLLNFVGQRHYMVNSAAFKEFFQGAEATKYEPKESVLQPHRLGVPDSDTDSMASTEHSSPEHSVSITVEDTTGSDQTEAELGGVWQYRQAGDDISLNDDAEEEEETTDVPIDSTPLPVDTAVDLFDPLQNSATGGPPSSSASASAATSNLWLLSSLEEQEEEAQSKEMLAITLSGSGQPSIKFEVGGREATDSAVLPNVPTGAPHIESGKGDLLTSPIVIQKPKGSDGTMLSQNDSPRRIAKNSSLLNLDLQDKGDYIVQAAKQISLAQHCEASGNFQMAFGYYKNGVGILLTGVQLDENETRREVVRRKTARYLMKAEQLHKQHLTDQPGGNRWDTGQLSPAKELDPTIALLQGSFCELRHFKVLGIIETVMLVMDVNTENTFIIKALPKSICESPSRSIQRCLVRPRGPFMVELYRFYDNNDVIYLLLQHATGGQLWNYVGHFLQQTSQQDDIGDVFDDPHEKRLRAASKDSMDTLREGTHDSAELTTEEVAAPIQTQEQPSERISRLDSALEDTIDIHIPNLNKSTAINTELLNVKYDATKQDHDFLSLDGSHDAAALRQALNGSKFSVSNKSDDVEETIAESPTENGNFQSLLEHTRKQPLAGFSVDSFDSSTENDPPSRQLSNNAERIGSIAEEPMAGINGGVEISGIAGGETKDEVFITDSVIKNSGEFLHRLDKELCDMDKDIGVRVDSGECVSNSNGKLLAGRTESSEEQSIYDCYNRQELEDSNSSNGGVQNIVTSTPNHKHGANQIEDNTDNSQLEDALSNSEENQSDAENLPQAENPALKVFKMVSQERSLELEKKMPRKRTLSSVFGELDLADEEERKKASRLPEGCVKQWAAEMVTAVHAFHQVGIICRDLKPANILLGNRGHLLLTHFSQWTFVDDRLDLAAMELCYVAPEVSGIGSTVTEACDWWSVGALLYELITGKTLCSCHPSGLTTHSTLYLPEHVSPEASSLLRELLKVCPTERLGVDDIKTHPFFNGIDWKEIEKY